MPDKISILKESGETLNSNVVSVFLIPDTQKRYIITTENAVDPHGLTVLHVSEIVDGTLQKVATDEEWSSIKTIMRAIISGNVGTFKYLPTIENIKASGQYSRDISVSASASKQMCDNYAAGDKNSINETAEATTETIGVGMAPQNVDLNGIVQQPEMMTQPSSIFPTNNAVPSADNELIPGIAEVSNSGIMNQPLVSEVPVNNIQPLSNTMSNPILPTNNMNDTSNVMSMNPVGIDNMMVNSQILNQIPTVNQTQIGIGMPVTEELNSGIQVAVPSQVVPTAQIAQEAQMPINNEINLSGNEIPSFAPNASLDEVVAGAQQMFMEGVKNLVQTIQEKVYREMYAKEAELKNKEAELEQKEKMLNEQMAMLNNNQGIVNTGMPSVQQFQNPVNVSTMSQQPMMNTVDANQNGMVNNGIQTPVMQPMNTNQMGANIQSQMQMNGVVQNQPMSTVMPPVNGPMVVSVSNDVI